MNSTNETPETDALIAGFECETWENEYKAMTNLARSLQTRLRSALRAIEEAPHEPDCEWQGNAARCQNCNEIQHDQIDRICTTCGFAMLEPAESREGKKA